MVGVVSVDEVDCKNTDNNVRPGNGSGVVPRT